MERYTGPLVDLDIDISHHVREHSAEIVDSDGYVVAVVPIRDGALVSPRLGRGELTEEQIDALSVLPSTLALLREHYIERVECTAEVPVWRSDPGGGGAWVTRSIDITAERAYPGGDEWTAAATLDEVEMVATRDISDRPVPARLIEGDDYIMRSAEVWDAIEAEIEADIAEYAAQGRTSC